MLFKCFSVFTVWLQNEAFAWILEVCMVCSEEHITKKKEKKRKKRNAKCFKSLIIEEKGVAGSDSVFW